MQSTSDHQVAKGTLQQGSTDSKHVALRSFCTAHALLCLSQQFTVWLGEFGSETQQLFPRFVPDHLKGMDGFICSVTTRAASCTAQIQHRGVTLGSMCRQMHA